MATNLNQAQVGQMGTVLLGHLIMALVNKGVLTPADVQAMKAAATADAPAELQADVKTLLDDFLEVRT